ncbi:MAG: DUF5788 family protein [Halobacteria archaeon]|nr:DUF5788 family protein [Halobacteria archaeon]
MEKYERETLLEKIEREGSFVGVEIPEKIELDDGDFELSEYVFEVRKQDEIPAELNEVKKKLRRKRTELRRKIEEDADENEDGEYLTYDEGKEMARLIAGIDRALTSLEQVGRQNGLNEEARRQEKADTKRWMNFLKKVTGSTDDSSKRRGR